MGRRLWLRADCYRQVLKGRINVLEKIKTAFSIVGAVLSIVLLTFLLYLLRRGNSDGRGSGQDSERAERIKDGLTDSSARARKCEERLQDAETILRNAISRSREREQEAE